MRLGYVIVYVADVPATLAFYEAAFGLSRRFLAEGGSYGELETGGTALAFAAEALVAEGGVVARPNRPGEVPAGAVSCKAPSVKPWGQTVAYVRDLNGFLVEICSPMGG